jgi:hypothetical protein
MSDVDSDDDDFCFELEVDDEITFKAPPRKIIETSRSSFIMPTFSIKKWDQTKNDQESDKENISSPKLSPNIMEHSSPLSENKAALKQLDISEVLDNNSTLNISAPSDIPQFIVDCEGELDEVHQVSINRYRYHICIYILYTYLHRCNIYMSL